MTFISCGELEIMPVHMNVVFSSEYFLFDSNLDEKKFASIVDELESGRAYILDFTNVNNTLTSDAIMKGADGIKGKKVLMINLMESAYSTFQGYLGNEVIDPVEPLQWERCLQTKLFSWPKKLPDLSDFKYLYNDLENRCRNNMRQEPDKPKLIPSNVYMNGYFDLRELFGDMDTVKIAVYLMATKLKKWEKEREKEKGKEKSKYKLISSSFNGCILANLLSLLIGREHIGIPHLGSRIADEDNRYVDNINGGDKLVYIYDFIALGNEQRTISAIAKLLNAEIEHSLGLSYFRPARSERGTIDSLIQLKKIIPHVCMAVSEEDLKKITGGKNA